MSSFVRRAERLHVPFLAMRPMHDPLRDASVPDRAGDVIVSWHTRMSR
jgi:hypothetical protein